LSIEPLRETERRILAWLVILSHGHRPVGAADIARKIAGDRWAVRDRLIKLVRMGLARRVDSTYIANLDRYLLYLLENYGDMKLHELVRKTTDFAGIEASGSRYQRLREKFREVLDELLSRYEVAVDASGTYSLATIGHIVAKILKKLGVDHRIDYSGGMIRAKVLCPNRFIICAYEGLRREDIDYILEINTSRLLRMEADSLEEYLRTRLWRTLHIMSTMLNEKIGLLNIIALAEGPGRRLLVLIRGDDITSMGREIINHANRRMNIVLGTVRRIWRERYRGRWIQWSTLIVEHHYALENALARIFDILGLIKKRQNIRLFFIRNKSEAQGVIEGTIKQWCREIT